MSVNRKAGAKWKETRHDRWYTLAKEQGYRSRAAFKLLQLNKKYNILSSAHAVLDLGAAPGGWLQVCVRAMPVSSLVLGVDLVPIKPLRAVTTIQADITTPECRTLIKKELQGWDVDVVLHDGAPNVAGGMVWARDAYAQNELVLHSLRLATHFMRPDAAFITKVFRSQDYNALLWVLQQLFASVDVTKPLASRNASAEIFVVCRGYKAPKKIDPHLLDPAHVFQQFDGADGTAPSAHTVGVFAKQRTKPERSRQGYLSAETATGIIGQRCDAMTFIDADEPIVTLGSYTAFDFSSERSRTLREAGLVTDEVLALCEDLKVLGKGDFKSLLRWRKKVRDWLNELQQEQPAQPQDGAAAEQQEEEEKSEEQLAAEEEQRMTAAILELKQRQQQRRRQERRKKHEIKHKQQQRLLLNKNNLTAVQEMIGADDNDELFNLSSVSASAMDLLETKAGDELDHAAGSEDDTAEEDKEREGEGEGEAGSDNEDAYLTKLERDLDSMFEQFKQRRKYVDKINKRKGDEEIRAVEQEQVREGEAEEDEADGSDEDVSDEETYQRMKVGLKRNREEEKEGEEEEEDRKRRNPLLVPLEEQEKIRAAERAKRWFQRDIFASAQLTGEREEKQEETEHAAMDDGDSSRAPAAAGAGAEAEEKSARRRTLIDMMTLDAATDSSDDEDEDGDDDDQTGRWLGADDGSSDEEQTARTSRPKEMEHRLVGLDSLSKTREQVEQESKQREKRAKKNVREQRRLQRKAEQEAAAAAAPSSSSSTSSAFASMLQQDEDDMHMLVDEDSKKKAKRMQKRADKLAGVTAPAAAASFEEVPAAGDGAVSSDDDAVALTLALGTRMLQKRQRMAVLDSSYNRYAVDVTEQQRLPSWFKAEEAVHMVAQLPVTKSEVDEYKQRLKAIDARPIRKIAEARMRKKVRTERRWEKIAKKVDDMQRDADTTAAAQGGGAAAGGSVGERLKRMEALMRKKDKRSVRGDRRYIVTRKGGGTDEVKRKKGSKKTGGLTVQVDRRLKKDKRGAKVAAKRGKKRQSTSNKRKHNV